MSAPPKSKAKEPTKWSEVVIEDDEDDEDPLSTVLQTAAANASQASAKDPLLVLPKEVYTSKVQQGNQKLRRTAANDPDQDLSDYSLSLQQDNFYAPLFLAYVHDDTSLFDLKRGIENLKQDSYDQAAQMKKLVKEHFEQFVQCRDSVESVGTLTTETSIWPVPPNDNYKGGKIKAEKYLDAAKEESEALFTPVLKQNQEVKSLKFAQHILDRYNYVFNLPDQLKQYLRQKEYEAIVREYLRVKSTIKDNELSVVVKGMEEVEIIIQQLREVLLKQLERIDRPVGEMQRAVELLQEIGCEEDPLNYLLNVRKQYVITQLENCSIQYASLSGSGTINVGGDSKSKVKISRVYMDKGSEILLKHLFDLWELSVRCIDEENLSKFTVKDGDKCIGEVIYEYLKLIKYLLVGDNSDDAFNEGNGGDDDDEEELEFEVESSENMSLKDIRYALTTMGKLIDSIISTSEKHFQRDEKKHKVDPFDIIKYGIEKVNSFYQKVYSSYSYLLFQDTENFTSDLLMSEKWEVVSPDNVIDIYNITILPQQFEIQINKALKQIDSVCRDEHHNHTKGFVSCFEVFCDNIDILTPQETVIEDLDELDGNSLLLKRNAKNVTSDLRLLLLISDINYTKEHIIPTITMNYELQEEEVNNIFRKLNELMKNLINDYVDKKKHIIEELLQNFNSDITWTDESDPEMIRDYVLEIFLQMIVIDNEIIETIGDFESQDFTDGMKFSDFIFTILLDLLFNFYKVEIPKISTFSSSTHVEVALELKFMSKIYEKYMSQKFKDIVKDCISHIEKHTYQGSKPLNTLPENSKSLLEELLQFSLARTILYTTCFSS